MRELDKVNWAAVAATDFRQMTVKEGKQAEFLICESFPWELVERIGVFNEAAERLVSKSLRNTNHKPLVTVEPTWYY